MKNQSPFWQGARIGLFLFLCFGSAYGWYHWRTGISPVIMSLLGVIIGGASFWIFEFIGKEIKIALNKTPNYAFAATVGMIGGFLLLKNYAIRLPSLPFFLTVVLGGLAQVLVFGGVFSFLHKTTSKGRSLVALLIGVALNLFGLYWWMQGGKDQYPVKIATTSILKNAVNISNPGDKGSYEIEYFTYGSKNSNRRALFNEEVQYQTPTVDASIILPEWKGKKAKWRERYWGFGVDSFPLNAHAWMPKGEGPFPLILIVHGNHSMEHFSDPGYAYLGEHLASRGFITLSIDENFINGTWSGDFRGREMPARAWLILKHLELWRDWNLNRPEMKGKARMDQILLAGHSRGGEAVVIAAAFNTLDHFPDNALIHFDFHFALKGLITIAPTDKRYFRRLELNDINYLTLQGSYDSDEASFFGNRLGQRITYTDTSKMINAGIVIHRANHGQFNSIWGSRDFGKPFGYLLNTGALILAEDQQEVAKVTISAFADAVLNDQAEYISSFREFGKLKAFLPEMVFLSTYRDNHQMVLSDYEEDINVLSATFPESDISSQGLTVWKEEKLQYRDQDFQQNNAVIVGWNMSDPLVQNTNEPYYQIKLGKGHKMKSKTSYFRFDISLGDESDLKLDKDKKEKESRDKGVDWTKTDFTIQLIDTSGSIHSALFSDFHILEPRLKIGFMKSKSLTKEILGNEWEPVLTSKYIPIDKFKPAVLNIGEIDEVRFRFDQSEKGILILDNIGFAW